MSEDEYCLQSADHPEFEFIECNNQIEVVKFRAYPTNGVLAHLDVTVADIPVVLEFMDFFEEFSGLLPYRVVEFITNFIPGASPISKAILNVSS